jgi:hypothetical protein
LPITFTHRAAASLRLQATHQFDSALALQKPSKADDKATH